MTNAHTRSSLHHLFHYTSFVFFFSSVCRSCWRIVRLLSATCPLWWVERQLSAVAFTFENKISTLWTTAHRTKFEVWQFVFVCLSKLRLKMWLISPTSWMATYEKRQRLQKRLNGSFSSAACNNENTRKFCVQSEMLKSNMNIYNITRGAPICF